MAGDSRGTAEDAAEPGVGPEDSAVPPGRHAAGPGAAGGAPGGGAVTPGLAMPSLVPLTEPEGGVPPVITSQAALDELAEALSAGSGPVAVDAERASGYRYGQRAYLVQVRRAGVGTGIVDPIALPDLRVLSEALGGVEWVVHAASQDLPCLAEVGLVPTSLFDTELAGRLLGRSRVGLGALVAEELGLHLAKEHSAVDWSTRPLPEEWLRYAALDVEVLVELRDRLAAHLAEAGKAQWAVQEFEAVRLTPAPEPRVEPWRRLPGLHQVVDRRRLAVARALWEERDAQAKSRNLSPGRILPDAAIVEAVRAMPRSVEQLLTIPQFAGRATRRRAASWQAVVGRALSLPESALPARHAGARNAFPPPRGWSERDPEAAARLERVRACVRAIAEANALPQENVLAPDTQRRLAWAPPEAEVGAVAEFLRASGARPWQVELCAAELAAALAGDAA